MKDKESGQNDRSVKNYLDEALANGHQIIPLMIDPLLMMSAITYWWNLGDDNRVMAREEQQWERIRGKRARIKRKEIFI